MSHPHVEEEFTPLRWRTDRFEWIDQTRLPAEEVWKHARSLTDVERAIRALEIRGAPAIGVAAAYGLVVALDEGLPFEEAWQRLLATRPTAVNLRWALERGRDVWREFNGSRDALLAWASDTHREDIEANRRIAAYGAALFSPGTRALTHCNAGALATAGIGTAVGVLTEAFRLGRLASVWVDETRPLLQGARLTAWELGRLSIPHRLITDSSAGALFSRGLVDAVVVGADRIAANGDTANKIGTYPLAVLAARHQVPFYVAAPLSTVDLSTPNGDAIPIEERDEKEVTQLRGVSIAPVSTEALNFAFDVTPAELIRAIITDAGVLRAPYDVALRQAVGARAQLSS